MIFHLTQKPSVATRFLRELRDKTIQTDSMRFRQNLRRVGQILAYEISQQIDYQNIKIQTPLGNFETKEAIEPPTLVTVMRAGLPFFDGFLDYFDDAPCAFVGAFRGKTDESQLFDIEMGYLASPDLSQKNIIIADPMIATGKSILKTYQSLLQFGTPKKCHVAGVIGSQTGIDFVQKNIPNVSIWMGDIDNELNDKFYIVPGLGDAGDLAYGEKL